MNPIERLFTSVIQQFLELAVLLVRGLFGGNIGPSAPPTPEEEDVPTVDPLEIEANDAP